MTPTEKRILRLQLIFTLLRTGELAIQHSWHPTKAFTAAWNAARLLKGGFVILDKRLQQECAQHAA